MKKRTEADRIVQIILLVLIAAGILGIIGTIGGGSDTASPGGVPGGKSVEAETGSKAIAVGVAEVGTADVREYIRVNGDVNSESSVNIYPDASGELVSIEVSVGDYVRRGQTVADVRSLTAGTGIQYQPCGHYHQRYRDFSPLRRR